MSDAKLAHKKITLLNRLIVRFSKLGNRVSKLAFLSSLVILLSIVLLNLSASKANAAVLSDATGDDYTYVSQNYIQGCPAPTADSAQCLIDIVSDSNGNVASFSSPDDYAQSAQRQLSTQSSIGSTTTSNVDTLSILRLHKAYNLPCKPNGGVATICSALSIYTGPVVALVEAYSNRNIENEL